MALNGATLQQQLTVHNTGAEPVIEPALNGRGEKSTDVHSSDAIPRTTHIVARSEHCTE